MVRVSARFELARVRVIGSQLYVTITQFFFSFPLSFVPVYHHLTFFHLTFFPSQFRTCIPSVNISKLYAESLYQKLSTKAGNIKNILLFKSAALLKCLRITDRLQNRHFFCLSYDVELYRLILACYFQTCSTPLP